MTQPMNQVEAERILSDHKLALTNVLAAGWNRWRSLVGKQPELGAILSNRTRASLVYDCIRHEATAAFHDDETVTVSEDRGFLLLTFGNRIILRFKKFRDGKLRTSPGSSRQAREYANQVLPGMEELTHLVAGYLPDDVGLDLEQAAITCSVGANVEWVIELDLTLVVGGIDEGRVLAPVTHVATSDSTVGTIVRPRRAEGDKQDADQQASSER